MAPSLLLLLLFRFVAVSIGVSCVSCASGVVGTGVMETGLLLAFFLALVAGGYSVMCAGIGAVTDLGINTADVVAFAGAGSISLAGEADVDLSSAFLGDFFFMRVTSIQSSAFFCWAWSGSFSGVASLIVTVETVVAAVSVVTVAAAAFGGKTSIYAPNCLQLQQRWRLPSTITIICLSLLTMVSGIA